MSFRGELDALSDELGDHGRHIPVNMSMFFSRGNKEEIKKIGNTNEFTITIYPTFRNRRHGLQCCLNEFIKLDLYYHIEERCSFFLEFEVPPHDRNSMTYEYTFPSRGSFIIRDIEQTAFEFFVPKPKEYSRTVGFWDIEVSRMTADSFQERGDREIAEALHKWEMNSYKRVPYLSLSTAAG